MISKMDDNFSDEDNDIHDCLKMKLMNLARRDEEMTRSG